MAEKVVVETPIEMLTRELARLKRLSDRAISQVDDAAFFERASEPDNSVAIIIKHIAGNMRSRWTGFLEEDGEKPDRNRDGEFEESEHDTRESLERAWESGWQLLFEALEPLTTEDHERMVTIRGEQLTVLQAIVRQLSHYAWHVGQLVLLAKHHAGDRWETLSIERGKSQSHNKENLPYL